MVDRTESRIVCDACPRAIPVDRPERVVVLPPPWRFVEVLGWGRFDACSDRCEAAVRARYVRPEPEVVVEEEEETAGRGDEPTLEEVPRGRSSG